MDNSIDAFVEYVSPRFSRLTEREGEVLGYIAEGLTRGKIGELLCLSSGTVRTHTDNVRRRLGVKGWYEMMASALIYSCVVFGKELSFPETSWLGLTVKQQDIFEMVGSGMEYEEIAPKLGNARRTVESIIFQQIAPKMAAVRGNDADSVPHSYLLACSVWNVVVKPYVQSHPEVRVFVNSQ